MDYASKEYKHITFNVYIDSSFSLNTEKGYKNINIFFQKRTLEKIGFFTKRINHSIYFGNLPPLIKCHKCFVYIHNTYLVIDTLRLFKNAPLKYFIKYTLQKIYIKVFSKNVDFVACQTNTMKSYIKKLIPHAQIETIPFYRTCPKEKEQKKLFDFCYVSLVAPHKKHMNLLQALEILDKKKVKLCIALTVDNRHEHLIEKIEALNERGNIEIINYGVLPKEKVCDVYNASRALVFPSTEESFGLPLIEAASLGLDVLTPDLKYVHDVVKPSLTFDAHSPESIAMAIEKYLHKDYSKTQCLIHNDIDKMIQLLL